MENNGITSRFKRAWNAFKNDPLNLREEYQLRNGSSFRPDRLRLVRGNAQTIIMPIYNKIALDVSLVNIQHARLDDNGRFLETIDSGLNNCLTLEANTDQTARAFIQDVVLSMFDEGSIAIVPTDTTSDPEKTGSYDINKFRTGKVVEWFPQHVKLSVYNELVGKKQEIILPKSSVAIIENPFYSVMNEPNSVVQRLIRKLNLLDAIDEQSGNGKLNLIIQLPYVVKTESKRVQAENRRREIESQLAENKYGIAYTDGTEKITQLNRPLENNLLAQIKYLTDMFYSQIGVSQSILDGTADDKTMLNYNNRIIRTILSALIDEMNRKFLTKTARTQKQSIVYFTDPFSLVPVSQIAEIADKFTRNEIMTSNEIRQIVGMKPSDDPNADELRNKNLSKAKEEYEMEEVIQNEQ